MNPVCIVTDSAAQFPQLTFNGRNLLTMISLKSQLNGQVYESSEEYKVSSLPSSADEQLHPRLSAPPVEEFIRVFSGLVKSYDTILGIFSSSHLTQACANALEAAAVLRGGSNIQVIDSQSISAGLGFLVEVAAENAHQGRSGPDIEYLVRSFIPHIYGVLSLPGLTYLYYNGFVDRSQAMINEMLGLYPIFAVEEGNLTPLEKLRNHRHTINYFQEFLDEFDNLQHIAFLQSSPPSSQEAQLLREHGREIFPKTPFTSHSINLPLATLFGPRSLGLFVVEAFD